MGKAEDKQDSKLADHALPLLKNVTVVKRPYLYQSYQIKPGGCKNLPHSIRVYLTEVFQQFLKLLFALVPGFLRKKK